MQAATGNAVPVASEVLYAPALLHMRATDRYVSDVKIENSTRVDLYRNGGGEKLEDHDEDRVEQTAGAAVVPLFQTGAVPLGAAAATVLVVSAMIWLSRPRGR